MEEKKKKRTWKHVNNSCKLTPEIQEKICSAMRTGVFKRAAAEYAGITYETLHNWETWGKAESKGKYHDFYQAFTKAMADADVADMALIGVAAQKDWRAAAWRLAKRHPAEYGDNQKVELSGSVSVSGILADLEKRLGEEESESEE